MTIVFFFFKRSLTNCISFLFSLFQLHHSSSPPSILLCRSTTDIPRDATSTSLPLCRLFTCKSLELFAPPKKYRPIAPENTFPPRPKRRYESGSPKLPSACGRGASSSWVPGASLCLSGSKAAALYVRNMIRMSETRK